MQKERRQLITSFRLTPNNLAWDFIKESDIIPISEGVIPKIKQLPSYPGVYGIASDTGFLYIGLARGKVCNRLGGRLDLKEKVLKFYIRHKTPLYFYSMEFSSKTPIGEVFADGFTSSANYHESYLIRKFSPLFNKKNPPLCLGYWEEIYYRELIVKQNNIQRFSKYLVNELKSRTSLDVTIKPHKDLIIKSREVINLTC